MAKKAYRMIQPRTVRRQLGLPGSHRRLPLIPPEPWRDQAACQDADVDLFFSAHGVPWATKLDRVAQYCDNCPVAAECYQHGLTQDDGIYGLGLVRSVGRTIKVKRYEHGTKAGYDRHRLRGEDPCQDCRRGKRDASRRERAKS